MTHNSKGLAHRSGFHLLWPSENLGCFGIVLWKLYLDFYGRPGYLLPGIFAAWNLNQHGTEYHSTAFRFWFHWSGLRIELWSKRGIFDKHYRWYTSRNLWYRATHWAPSWRVPFPRFVYRAFRRRQWTANPADPTMVVQWKARRGRFEIVILVSWGIECKVHIGRYVWRTYDGVFGSWLYDRLEDRWMRETYDEPYDEMGRLEDYE